MVVTLCAQSAYDVQGYPSHRMGRAGGTKSVPDEHAKVLRTRGHMVSASHTAHNIEVTAESLQEDLARLQIQKQALERELAAVVAHLGSVQRALSAFETLMRDPAAAAASTGTAGAAVAEPGQAATPVLPQTDIASPESADATTTSAPRAQKPESGKDAKRPPTADADADGQKKYGMLTEQIMEYF